MTRCPSSKLGNVDQIPYYFRENKTIQCYSCKQNFVISHRTHHYKRVSLRCKKVYYFLIGTAIEAQKRSFKLPWRLVRCCWEAVYNGYLRSFCHLGINNCPKEEQTFIFIKHFALTVHFGSSAVMYAPNGEEPDLQISHRVPLFAQAILVANRNEFLRLANGEFYCVNRKRQQPGMCVFTTVNLLFIVLWNATGSINNFFFRLQVCVKTKRTKGS